MTPVVLRNKTWLCPWAHFLIRQTHRLSPLGCLIKQVAAIISLPRSDPPAFATGTNKEPRSQLHTHPDPTETSLSPYSGPPSLAWTKRLPFPEQRYRREVRVRSRPWSPPRPVPGTAYPSGPQMRTLPWSTPLAVSARTKAYLSVQMCEVPPPEDQMLGDSAVWQLPEAAVAVRVRLPGPEGSCIARVRLYIFTLHY